MMKVIKVSAAIFLPLVFFSNLIHAQALSCSSYYDCVAQAKASRVSWNEVGANAFGTWLFVDNTSTSIGQSATRIASNPWRGGTFDGPSLLAPSAAVSWDTSTFPVYLGNHVGSLIDPNKGFTIMLVYLNNWDPATFGDTNGVSVSMINGSNQGELFSLGRKGEQWTFGRHIFGINGTLPGSSSWQTPWDPISTVVTWWEWVYYTFTPDGKVRIDKFVPHAGTGFSTWYDWQESVLDAGYPFKGFPSGGTPTTNPPAVSFYTAGDLVTGSGLDGAGNNSYATRPVPVPGFNRVDVFNIPFTRDQMVAYQKNLVGSYKLAVGATYPCNTGFWMNSATVYTPCGYAGGGNPPASTDYMGPSGAVVRASGSGSSGTTPVIFPPQNLSAAALSDTSVELFWDASPSPTTAGQADSSVTQYQVIGGSAPVNLSPSSACSAGHCTATLSGLTAGQTYSFYMTAVSSTAMSFPSDVFILTPTVISAGTGTSYPILANALAALPAAGGTITIAPGTYHEKLQITKPNVTLLGLGTDASKVVIAYGDSVANGNDSNGVPIPRTNPATGKPFSTSGTYTVDVKGNNFYATNLTIQNTADYTSPNFENNGQAVALMMEADRSIFRAVLILGGQDTLYIRGAGKRSYFTNCYIEGYVDYIFGDGKAVLDNCQLKTKIHSTLNGEATITAQNRASANDDDGFVIANSSLLFDDPYMNNVWLGRPWGAYATTYFVNTKMDKEVVTQGWIEFVPLPVSQGGTNNLPTSTYREYGTLYPGTTAGTWTSFPISGRESVSPSTNVPLTAAEAASLGPTVYLAAHDGWDPTLIAYGSHTQQLLPIPGIAVGVPGKPTIISTVAGNGNIQISWTGAPANPVETGYSITATQSGHTYGPMSFPANASSGYISGLANGVPATVTLVEVNAKGSGAGVQVTASPVSHDPSAPVVSSIGVTNSTATVNFTVASQGSQPVWDGLNSHGIYFALYSSVANFYANAPIAGTAGGQGASSPITSVAFHGLTANTTYYVSLQAYNGWYSPKVLTQFKTSP